VKNGSAAVGLQMIGNPTELLEGHQNHQIFPGGYYSQQDWDWLHDPGVTCAADIIQRARQLVERGITREQALPVQNRRVAGPVDIVLVTGCPYLQTFS
jgi:hypothetical protein